MAELYDVAVIGAGLMGAAVSYELAIAGLRVVVLESERDVCAGASRSNSGILHSGFDSKPGDLETQLILRHQARFHPVFKSLGIPIEPCGALLLARSPEEQAQVEALAANASINGVATKLIGRSEVARLEPNAPAVSGLLVPGESITDPYEVVRRLLSNRQEVRLGFRVQLVEPAPHGVDLVSEYEPVRARFAVNCAGLFADCITSDDLKVTPRKGEFLAYPKGSASLIHHILLPVPSKYTKGILVFPTIYGHLVVGPTALDVEDKTDWKPRAEALALLHARASEALPALKDLEPEDGWAGLRTVGHPKDYAIQWSQSVPEMVHVLGIRSTGLSSCLGISEYVLAMLVSAGLELGQRQSKAMVVPCCEGLSRPWWRRLNELRGIDASWN